MSTQETIIKLLLATDRQGIDELVEYLIAEGFFTAPASSRFHGCYVGGLADHSLRVYELLKGFTQTLKLDQDTSAGKKPLKITDDTVIVAGLLHDCCKIGAYIPTPDGKNAYKWNKSQPKGHARLSIERIKKYIVLEPLEEMIILSHMGLWGLNEFYEEGSWQSGEFPLRGDHSNDKEKMTREEKEESQKARYGKSLANMYYHNIICFFIHAADMIASAEEKAKES